MFATKHEPDALDLSTRRQASPSLEQADDEDENYSLEDGSHPKVPPHLYQPSCLHSVSDLENNLRQRFRGHER